MLKDILKEGNLNESDIALAEGIISSASVALFAAQANGLIRFPARPYSIGEIESKLRITVEAFFTKLVELSPNKD